MSNSMVERRRQSFKIEILEDVYGLPGEKYIRFTTNGYQWNGFGLLPDEMRQMRDLLDKELKGESDEG